MMSNLRCHDKERLIAHLYGEDDSVERHETESHLAQCDVCSIEIAELRAVRTQLAEWRTPEIDLGFRVVREPLAQVKQTWWSMPVPAWAAGMAAVLMLAAAAAIANVEVRYDPDGLSVRTGWSSTSSVTTAHGAGVAGTPVVAPARASMSDAAWRAALAETERRLRTEFAHTEGRRGAAAPASGRDELLRQVRTLLEESERRQQRELALRLTQLVQDIEVQRRADLVQIEQNFGQIEGFTNAEAVRQRALLNHLVRVSQGQ
jgi:anti-sigma factor RsiW